MEKIMLDRKFFGNSLYFSGAIPYNNEMTNGWISRGEEIIFQRGQ